MFEFDEHFAELEVMGSEQVDSQPQDGSMLPMWHYMGNGVWKLDFEYESDTLQASQEWLLNTADVT